MSAKTIRNALGLLQDDPDSAQAWADLRSALGVAPSEDSGDARLDLPADLDASSDDIARLLERARRAHATRHEFEAVANLLEIEARLAKGTEREATLVSELARVLEEGVLDDARAVAVYARLLVLRPGDERAEEAIETADAKRARWQEIVTKYKEEAERGDEAFKSSLLVSAAEVQYRYGRPHLASAGKKKKRELPGLIEEIVTSLKEALAIDPKNARAAHLLERVYRDEERWEDVAGLLEVHAADAPSKDAKVAGYMRLARLYWQKMPRNTQAQDKAEEAYAKVLDLVPGNVEATSALVDVYTAQEKWDHLVSLYDGQLAASGRGPQDTGTILQVAMVHWKMRSKPDAAEPYFERLRKQEPAHPGMLGFFREHLGAKGETARLTAILTDAQRTLPEGPERVALVAEIARLSEDSANASKAIENWRNLLRQDPTNAQGRAALKRLYRQTGGWNALTDLLRQEMDRLPQTDGAARMEILREIASVYRDHVKSDSALVTVLTQIIALAPTDIDAVRELVRVYDSLGRWRDLLTTQTRLAELETEPGAKAELYRAIARRWLDQFSNVQNAVEAYEKLAELAPDDDEALQKLKELYVKRRAYKPLYDLLDRQAGRLGSGAARREVWLEMAKIAAERLDRGAEAAGLYKRLLEEDPSATGALDALEKQAERDKDYKTVAEVLERRVAQAGQGGDDASKLALLQKLGAVYADRLQDAAGAKASWRRVLELAPGHPKALRVLRDSYVAMNDYDGLTDLYASNDDWEGLAEVLSSAADRGGDPALKIDLSYRAADIYTNRLNAPERAFRAYERVLATRPGDKRAATALIPLYEKEEKWARLPALYEVLLAHAEQDARDAGRGSEGHGARDAELTLLHKLASVTGQQLGDRTASFGYARRAYALGTTDDAAALARFEKAAHDAGAWSEFVDALTARLDEASKADRRALRAKIAQVQSREGQIDESVALYKQLIEEDETDEASLHALDKLLRDADRQDDLRWLFEERIRREGTAQKVELLTEWAVLEEDAFQAPERAIAIYRRVLDLVPNHGGALRALARLLRTAGDNEGAVQVLLVDRDQREGADRAAREVEIAQLYMQLKKPSDALAAARRALDLVKHDLEAILVVEELLSVGETRAQAAVILEHTYAETGQLPRQAEVLEVRIATAAAKEDRIELYSRLADVHEKLAAFGVAFDVVARAAREFPAELGLWDRLGVLAQRTKRSQQFVAAIADAVPPTGETGLPAAVETDLADRAATLYEEMLGEPERARPYLERILGRDPTSERAFMRLKQILTSSERWVELELLYERAFEASPDPVRKGELLTEIALVAEEITGDKPKAITFYERILALAPNHDQAARSLDALYTAEQRWQDLARLLTARVATALGSEATVYKLRLGTLHFSRLGEPKKALEYLEDVLSTDSESREARDLVERCLEVPELREHAALVLERVYFARDEIRDLVRVLEIRLEFEMDALQKRELLRRVAELRDERLNDDAGAFDAYSRFVPLAPADEYARTRLLEIGNRMGAHERAAEVLLKGADAADAPQPRADILGEVARIYEGALADPVRAEAVYKRVLQIDPDDAELALPTARALEKIYTASGKSAELSHMLKVQVKLEADAPLRRELLARIGELAETTLADPKGAIEAWKSRLEDDPTDERALAALDRLYELTSEHRALVDVLRARERAATDQEARKVLMLRIATTLADKLTDVPEAILAYRAVIEDFGASVPTHAALATLYEIADRWQDLADTLEAQLALETGEGERLALLARLGHVRQHKTADVDGAIEAYRQALAIRTSHPASRAALEGLTEPGAAASHGGAPELRREAALILRPLYEAEADHAKLLRVLDIETEYADTLPARLRLIAEAMRVAEGPLHELTRAWGYAARGVRDSASEPQFAEWLAHAERLAELTASHAALVTLLKEVIPEIVDGDLQLDVTLKVASLARGKLVDADLAREYYVKALELRADERRALTALESLYEEKHDAPALLDILKRRAEAAVNDEERKAVLYKQARLDDETLHDAPAAIDVYEDILAITLDEPAITALTRLYTAAERWDDLIALHEREIGAGGADARSDARKADLFHALGQVHQARLGNHEQAFDQYEAALKIDPQHAATVASLEHLMTERPHAAQAAEMLEAVYLTRLDWRQVMKTLEARLDVSQDPDERRTLLMRLAKLHEEQGEDYKAALETTAKLLAEEVSSEPTWAELERLARVANAEARLAEIFATELGKVTSDEPATARLAKRTGELFEQQKETDRALSFYRRAHAFAPEDDNGSFEAIDRLLRESNRPAERVALYRQALDYRDEPKERLATLHTIALLEEVDLQDDDRAIETHRAALDVDESDTHALEALARLYARRERWRDLADLARRRAEQSALPEDEAKFRLDLGRLLETKLSELTPAIDEYQAVTELAAPPAETGKLAVAALESLLARNESKARIIEILRPLYERADSWRSLVDVNEQRLEITDDAGEKIAILRETARLWEERGEDKEKAFDAVRDAFILDPDDGGARAELDRLAEATKRWDTLAEAYEQGIGRTEGLGQRELLGALARVHDRRRDDPRRALEAWDRLFKQDESDIAPLEEMESLATLLSDWPTLVRVLTKKAELLSSDDDRASTWRRIGEARRDMLDDLPGAIEAYERALELDGTSTLTLDFLIQLYEQKDDAARLVDLYRRRVDLSSDDDAGLKHQLLVDAATRYETGLDDRREAIQHLNEALAVKPGDVDVLKRLDALYTHERMWPELLDNLRLQVGVAGDEASKRYLKKRVGALLAGELDDPQQSLDAYREVIASEYDADAASAIRAIGEAREELRADAASALEPVLRGASRWSELADVLEMRLRAQTEPNDRAGTLRSIAEVAESRLGDARRALGALLRALAEEPHDARLHDEIERLAGQLGGSGWPLYADALTERAAQVFEPAVTADLYMRLGRIAEENLNDDARAARAYAQAAEQSGDNVAVLTALDRLYGRLADTRGLADVLERRIALEADPRVQAELFHRLASIQIREFNDRSRGLSTLRQALERHPEHGPSREATLGLLSDEPLFDEAFDALEMVYRQLSQHEDLAKLYERRVARALGSRDRSRARLELARVLEEQVGDPARAQRVVEDALGDDAADEDALAELERLAARTDGWSRAATALDLALREPRDLASGTQGELWVRLATWRRDKLSDARGAEEAFGRALAADPENVDILRALETLRRAPGRERDLVATLRQRAKLETELDAKRVLLREAKELAQNVVGDRELAEDTLRAMLDEDEGDAWALDELTRLREQAGDFKDVVTLLLRRAELDGAGEMAALQHRAARVMIDSLKDAPRAIALYEEILERDPHDAVAAASLRTLYSDAGRDRDLGKLLELQIETAGSAEERARLRLDLARLQEEKFSAPRDAVDTLREILDEEPTHEGAVTALSLLLEKTGQDEELADLLSTQIDRAHDRGDAAVELALQVRLGEVFETRLKDTPRALAAYEAVLDREPAHRGALEAVARLSESRGAWDRASSALAKLVELGTDRASVPEALRLAQARETLGDAQGVEDALRRAIDLDPENVDVRDRLRTLYERGRKWDELAALLVGDADLVHAKNPNAEPAPQLPSPADMRASSPSRASMPPGPGATTLPPPPSTGPIAEQVRLLRRAAEIHLRERAAPADAVPLLERATLLTPTDRELMMMLCDAYTAAGRARDAALVLERVIASFGNRRTKELSLYHHRLGRALASLGDKDVALAQFDMAFKIDPGSVSVLKDLGVLALETNDLDRAQKTFRALLLQRLDPTIGISKGEVFYYLGEISAKQGDKAKAVQMLERAIENEPSLARAKAMLTELKS
jgi:tetratricopeptide (TPR) repeat protein